MLKRENVNFKRDSELLSTMYAHVINDYNCRVSTGTQNTQIARISLKVARNHANSMHFGEEHAFSFREG